MIDYVVSRAGIDLFVVARQIRLHVPGERSVSRAGAER